MPTSPDRIAEVRAAMAAHGSDPDSPTMRLFGSALGLVEEMRAAQRDPDEVLLRAARRAFADASPDVARTLLWVRRAAVAVACSVAAGVAFSGAVLLVDRSSPVVMWDGVSLSAQCADPSNHYPVMGGTACRMSAWWSAPKGGR